MKIYNEVIIGSGPCAYAYLLAKKKLNNSLLVSTDLKSIEDTRIPQIHSKLIKNGKSVVSRKINNSYVTSAYGGLSNSWGGTLVKVCFDQLKSCYPEAYEKEKWETAYNRVISDLSKHLTLINQKVSQKKIVEIFTVEPPHRYGWESSQLSIIPCIDSQISRLNIEKSVGTEVTNIKMNGDLIKLHLSTGNFILTKKVVVSAGTTGNQILLNKAVDIQDHAPFQLVALKKKSKIDDKCYSPITGYDVSREHISVYYSLNKLSDDFKKRELGLLGEKVLKILTSLFNVFVVLHWNSLTVTNSVSQKISKKHVLISFLKLVKNKHFPLFYRKTVHGEGFHYVDRSNNIDYFDLKKKGIVVLGGNRMKELCIYNPSLTFMAHSFIEGMD